MDERPDSGARCDEHVGEVFPVRCSECESLSAVEEPAAVETFAGWPQPVPELDEWRV